MENKTLSKIMQIVRSDCSSSSLNLTPAVKKRGDRHSFTLILPTSNCSWARVHGGCTICGFANLGSSESNSEDQTIAYVRQSLQIIDGFQGNLKVNIFGNGSFFDIADLSKSTRDEILSLIARNQAIEMLSVESRPEFLTHERVSDACSRVEGKKLEIRIGLETYDDFIRYFSINKGFLFQDFLERVNQLKASFDPIVKVAAYITVKPPFLTEKEALDDAYASIIMAHKAGVDRCIVSPISIHTGTLVHFLWNEGLYTPPWLWTLWELRNRFAKRQEVVSFSGFNPKPSPLSLAKNCGKCDRLLTKTLKNFQREREQTPGREKITCECFAEWQKIMQSPSQPLSERIPEIYKTLCQQFGVESETTNVSNFQTSRYSIGYLKNDCLERGLTETVIGAIRNNHLEIIEMKNMVIDETLINELRPYAYGKEYINSRNETLRGGNITVLLVKGDNAISRLNSIKREIRSKFAIDLFRNVLHSADTFGEFLFELNLLFPEVNFKINLNIENGL